MHADCTISLTESSDCHIHDLFSKGNLISFDEDVPRLDFAWQFILRSLRILVLGCSLLDRLSILGMGSAAVVH